MPAMPAAGSRHRLAANRPMQRGGSAAAQAVVRHAAARRRRRLVAAGSDAAARAASPAAAARCRLRLRRRIGYGGADGSAAVAASTAVVRVGGLDGRPVGGFRRHFGRLQVDHRRRPTAARVRDPVDAFRSPCRHSKRFDQRLWHDLGRDQSEQARLVRPLARPEFARRPRPGAARRPAPTGKNARARSAGSDHVAPRNRCKLSTLRREKCSTPSIRPAASASRTSGGKPVGLDGAIDHDGVGPRCRAPPVRRPDRAARSSPAR